MHDRGVYENPDVFRPERFIQDGKLNLGAQDPTSFVFGYGRRHVALMAGSSFLALGYSLLLHPGSVLDVISRKTPYLSTSPACYMSSTSRLLSEKTDTLSRLSMSNRTPWFRACLMSHGIPLRDLLTVYCSYPEDCRCTIKPRSATAEMLIRSCAEAARSESKG